MATKNYAQMSTKKLNALLETADVEEKAAIMEVLAARNAASAGTAPKAELSEEEKEAIAAAEADSNAVNKPSEQKEQKEKPTKMTDEEREALANKLRAEAVNHKCKVVLFNSLEWVDGTVVSIIEEKRSNKVMFAVKTDDGRRVIKNHDSKLIQILDETVERTVRTRTRNADGEAATSEPWTDEEIEAAVEKVIGNVGKTVSYPEAGAYGQIADDAATITGRITSLVPAKRSKSILYRIEIVAEDGTKKYAHKVSTLNTLSIAEELDEEGKKINDAFVARRSKEPGEPKVSMNEKQAFDYYTDMYEKAKAALEKAQQLLEKREAKLNEAKVAYEAAVAEGKTFEEPEPEVEVVDETQKSDDDLM